jgi:tRNA pseudouridine(38-40) synthase
MTALSNMKSDKLGNILSGVELTPDDLEFLEPVEIRAENESLGTQDILLSSDGDGQNLDFIEMKKASQYFMGPHDFAAFRSTGSSVKTSIRTITSLELDKSEDIITMFIEADGFLYNMVRIISGTLIEVGRGKISERDIPDIIKSCDRQRAGQTAPASGLCLERIYY